MTTATLTSKGQITIPAEVREALGVESGTALKGMFGKPRKAVSISDMNAAIARRGASAK